MENLILQQFRDWLGFYKNENDLERKKLCHQRMVGFIIGLELAGKNIEANECKELYENLIKF